MKKQSTFDKTFDAIIGLAYPTMAEKAGLPLMDQMMEEKLLKRNVFTFFLSSNPKE